MISTGPKTVWLIHQPRSLPYSLTYNCGRTSGPLGMTTCTSGSRRISDVAGPKTQQLAPFAERVILPFPTVDTNL